MHRPALLLGLVAIAATTYASSASAALITRDLFTAGDGLITRDTGTGLDWLDLPATRNVSYNDVEADVGGWISLGFRHATGGEVCGLLATHALAPASCPGPAGISQNGNLVATLQGFVGVTFSDRNGFVASSGVFDDGDVSDSVGSGAVSYQPLTGRSNSSVLEDGAFAHLSSGRDANWLVRPVPEPSTALLVAAGLVAFAVRRRPRRRA